MKQHKKLDTILLIIYFVCFAWSLLYFWVLAGPTGLMDMLIWQYILLFVLCPSIMLILQVVIKGISVKTFILIIAFWFFNSINFWLTWNISWFIHGGEVSSLLSEIGFSGHLTIPASLVGILVGVIIRAIVKGLKKAKAEQE